MSEPTAYEQYLLELINRDRLDPQAALARIEKTPTWTVDYALPPLAVPVSPSQPLAWNPLLADAAAAGVGTWEDGAVLDRIKSRGYLIDPAEAPLDVPAGVSIFGPFNTRAHLDPIADSLFVHRNVALLDPDLKEAGLSLTVKEWVVQHWPDDPWTGTSAVSVEGQLTAARPVSGTFLTGVAFRDADGDRFYDPGEGLPGVTVTVTPVEGGDAPVATTNTWSAGGYSLNVAPGQLAVEISGPGLAAPMELELTAGNQNVELDVLGDGAIAAAADLVLGDGVCYAKLLGVGKYTVQVGDQGATVHGNRTDNVLIGGAGNDRFNGGGGRDRMEGGPGDDFYVLDSHDIIVEKAGEGTDSIATTYRHFGIPDHIENVSLIGQEPQQVWGNALGNTVLGNDWTNALTGAAGNDILFGKGGDDGLAGGSGFDTLMGGSGADRFIFTPGTVQTADVIGDFDYAEGDRIDLSAFGVTSDQQADSRVHVEQHGTAATLALDGVDIAVLLNTASDQFTSDWLL